MFRFEKEHIPIQTKPNLTYESFDQYAYQKQAYRQDHLTNVQAY